MPPTSPPTRDVKTVSFISLGCPKNLVDSEKMLGTLAEAGYALVDSDEPADAIVINTCGFLEASKEESVDTINEAIERKNAGELKRVVVAGCLVQRHRAKLLEWAPGIDAMIGVFDRDHVIDAVDGSPTMRADAAGDNTVQPAYWIAGNALQAARERDMKTVGLTVQGADGKGIGYFEDDAKRFRLTPRHWAYLRVSEGCNQKCTFCTIPSIRGKMRSKPLDRIVAEARQLMADGVYELNLIGQDTTSYGFDISGRGSANGEYGLTPLLDDGEGDDDEGGGPRTVDLSAGVAGSDPRTVDLISLLTALNDVAAGAGGGWMRLMYVYPTHFTDAMIEAIANLPNIVKYIDIPLQHVTDPMLTTMRRNIDAARQAALLHKLRDRIPGLAIRTTFITGFPGETEDDHRALLEFIEDFQFDMLGVFQYSCEPGTPAARLDSDPDLHVPEKTKARRESEIMLAQQAIAFENATYLAEQGCQFDVLIDGVAEAQPRADSREPTAHTHIGRCYHQAPQVDSATHVRSADRLSPGEVVRCTIVGADGYDLLARPTAELERSISLPVAQLHEGSAD